MAGGQLNCVGLDMHRILQVIDVVDGLDGLGGKRGQQKIDADADRELAVLSFFRVEMTEGEADGDLLGLFEVRRLKNLG